VFSVRWKRFGWNGAGFSAMWLLAIQQVFSQLGGNGSAGMEPAIQQLLLAT
jgi:hypothetical protein